MIQKIYSLKELVEIRKTIKYCPVIKQQSFSETISDLSKQIRELTNNKAFLEIEDVVPNDDPNDMSGWLDSQKEQTYVVVFCIKFKDDFEPMYRIRNFGYNYYDTCELKWVNQSFMTCNLGRIWKVNYQQLQWHLLDVIDQFKLREETQDESARMAPI